jgi:hypothetical protein
MCTIERPMPEKGIETAAIYDARGPVYTRCPNNFNASDAK